MTVPTYFDDFISNISLTEEQKDNLQKAHTELQEFLAKEKSIADVYVTTFLQGSYRRSTALKPVNGDASDVDVVLVTTVDYENTKPSVFLKRFYDLMVSHYDGHCRMQGRSIGIDLGDVSMDLVPVAVINPNKELPGAFSKMYSSNSTLEELLNSKDDSFSDNIAYDSNHPLMISDRKSEQWEKTHPLAQLKWTQDKNKNCNGHYLHVVKAIKWWHKIQHPEQEHPNSYPLEHFVGDCCPDRIKSIAEGVVSTLETMKRIPSKPRLYDRGMPEHDVFSNVTDTEYKLFYKAVCEASVIARQAYDSTDVASSVKLWRILLGNEFPEPPKGSISFTKRTEPTKSVPRGNFA